VLAWQENKFNEAHRRAEDGESRSPALPRTLCPIRFAFWADVPGDFRHFLPVCPLCVGINQAQIGDAMLLVVAGQIPVSGATSQIGGSSGGGAALAVMHITDRDRLAE
jgi:hypothetical protein